eukprot:CAMPEP_0118860430 /NCGR_PEP_ID=MMETSP1163-20130328/6281_1 /TAXON_ID=124430 /ORGANISM="Phaeomonas parva, Strain CCMP2877" /LENGTH=115 /DNA_ID=CAMNT_0006794117 /DNA_START=110 /DNA_END=457 /DNA_ORIENTATION=-
MNAPDRSECWTSGYEDDEQVTYAKDTKIPNAGTFTILREDHTLGNLLRLELLRDPSVRFAGYIAPHPLEHRIKLRVQATDDKTPIVSVTQAIDHLTQQFDTLSKSFDNQALKFKE